MTQAPFGTAARPRPVPAALTGWALFGALAIRDPALAVHAARGAVVAGAVAGVLGVPVGCDDLFGWLLRDAGQLQVPPGILARPGPLTDAEQQAVAAHPQRSALLLHQAGLPEAAAVAFAHHERWDGRGYPLGLRGPQVPLSALLCVLGDAYAALTAPRPHRPRRTPREAVALICTEEGRQFAPGLPPALRVALRDLPPACLTFVPPAALGEAGQQLARYAERAAGLSRGKLEALFACALGLDAHCAARRLGRTPGTQRNWSASLRRTLAVPHRLPLRQFFAAVGRQVYEAVASAAP